MNPIRRERRAAREAGARGLVLVSALGAGRSSRSVYARSKGEDLVSAEALAEARTLQNLGIAPHAVETIVPRYLVRFRPRCEFSARAV